jgi:hypothetical protein
MSLAGHAVAFGEGGSLAYGRSNESSISRIEVQPHNNIAPVTP